jgi:5-methyltetrahydropteroyltriglutamate--homocysteine methyltransferase
MVTLSADRILTTHVGSLPRSDAVCDVLLKKERGEGHDPAAFDATVRDAVAETVARQAEVGLDVVSDGETSKITYATYIKDRVEGFGGEFTPKPHLDMAEHPDYREIYAKMRGPQLFRRTCCVDEIRPKADDSLAKDLANFRAALDGVANAGARVVEGFLNAASPGVVASFQPNRHYPSHEAYIEALAAVMQPEYEAIVGAGFLLQVDCPDLAMSRHTGFQELSEAEFLKRAAFHVEVLNQALANVPRERVRIHLCWGNYEGPHTHDIALETILGIVLGAKAGAISFEAANPRHEHEWTVWRDADARDVVLMPGVLDTSSNYVEHPELVAQRIERFAGVVGRERVIASTDCGFGTFAGTAQVAPSIAWAKLGALVEGARIASGRLY